MALRNRLLADPVTANAIDYSHLATLLNRSGSPLPLAELHGGLCGVICASGRKAAAAWLEELIDDCSADNATLAELETELKTLGTETFNALSGWSLEFAPLLPGDDSALAQRAEALALWCHGFLAGLIVGGVDLAGDPSGLSAEINELVRDFAEISRAGAPEEAGGPGETGGDDSADGSLTELIEFVRVGAQYIFEELVAGTAGRDAPTIH
jgi:uncharacterized protein YgfB (UPF0149 family)